MLKQKEKSLSLMKLGHLQMCPPLRTGREARGAVWAVTCIFVLVVISTCPAMFGQVLI